MTYLYKYMELQRGDTSVQLKRSWSLNATNSPDEVWAKVANRWKMAFNLVVPDEKPGVPVGERFSRPIESVQHPGPWILKKLKVNVPI